MAFICPKGYLKAGLVAAALVCGTIVFWGEGREFLREILLMVAWNIWKLQGRTVSTSGLVIAFLLVAAFLGACVVGLTLLVCTIWRRAYRRDESDTHGPRDRVEPKSSK